MSKEADILNSQNALLDSEEEDDDFEPEVPITNDGLFVTTRSGKGGDGGVIEELMDVNISLKRKAASLFDEMMREEESQNEQMKKKRRIGNGFKILMTTDEDSSSYFGNLVNTIPVIDETIRQDSELKREIEEAIVSIREQDSKEVSTRTVRFAGQMIEIASTKESNQALDNLVNSIENKKTISTVDKSYHDWDKYKDQEGIREEVEKAKQNGYLDRQEFLSRVDHNLFEKERDERERERVRRDNERRQQQHYYVC